MTTLKTRFAERLRFLMTEGDWTDQALAAKAHVTDGMIARYRGGDTLPREQVRDRLAHALGVTEDQLLGIAPLPPEGANTDD